MTFLCILSDSDIARSDFHNKASSKSALLQGGSFDLSVQSATEEREATLNATEEELSIRPLFDRY